MNRIDAVVEILVIAGNHQSVFDVARFLGADDLGIVACRERDRACADPANAHLTYAETAIEAAYRRIERTPRLRREWFGR